LIHNYKLWFKIRCFGYIRGILLLFLTVIKKLPDCKVVRWTPQTRLLMIVFLDLSGCPTHSELSSGVCHPREASASNIVGKAAHAAPAV
jgi:hypothetical protein